MRLLVTGGRDLNDYAMVDRFLRMIHEKRGIDLLIEGGATGADRLCRNWAERHGVPFVTEDADWKKYGLAAGPIRNGMMLSRHKPDGVLAFKGHDGTADMIAKAEKAGLKVLKTWEKE